MIKHIQPVSPGSTSGLFAQVYPQIKRDSGALAEPFTLHAPAPRLLAGVWIATRETVLAGNVCREIKEAVAATVSRLNQCPYCADAHTIMLHATAAHDLATARGRQAGCGDGMGQLHGRPQNRNMAAPASTRTRRCRILSIRETVQSLPGALHTESELAALREFKGSALTGDVSS